MAQNRILGITVFRRICEGKKMKLRTIILTDPVKAANKINGEKTLKFFEESVISRITDVTSFYGNECLYFLAYKDNNLVGVAVVSEERTDIKGPMSAPYIMEFGTVNYTKTCKYAKKGIGEELLNHIIKQVGSRFTLSCLDSNSEQFWRHMGEKKGLKVEVVGITVWCTPILYFWDFKD